MQRTLRGRNMVIAPRGFSDLQRGGKYLVDAIRAEIVRNADEAIARGPTSFQGLACCRLRCAVLGVIPQDSGLSSQVLYYILRLALFRQME
jgi:hypothetical protein